MSNNRADMNGNLSSVLDYAIDNTVCEVIWKQVQEMSDFSKFIEASLPWSKVAAKYNTGGNMEIREYRDGLGTPFMFKLEGGFIHWSDQHMKDWMSTNFISWDDFETNTHSTLLRTSWDYGMTWVVHATGEKTTTKSTGPQKCKCEIMTLMQRGCDCDGV